MNEYAELLEQVQLKTPNLVEMTALSAILHSFYNGLENVFLLVAKGIDQKIPKGEEWHRQLLDQMIQTTSNRPPVITKELADEVDPYLSFRHFHRHAYSFLLRWSKMEELVLPVTKVWGQLKTQLLIFISSMDK